MAAPTKRFNIAAGKPYTTRDGQQKKQWVNLGRATQWDDGTISLELHAMPAGNWFDGKAYLFDADDQQQSAPPQQSGGYTARRQAPAPQQTDPGDVPF